MRIIIEGHDLPGTEFVSDGVPLHNVHVAVQVGKEPIDPVRGNADGARWEIEVRTVVVDGGMDLRGPAVHGRKGERFLYLTWGDVGAGDSFAMFRRAKLMIEDIEPEMLAAAATRRRRPRRLALIVRRAWMPTLRPGQAAGDQLAVELNARRLGEDTRQCLPRPRALWYPSTASEYAGRPRSLPPAGGGAGLLRRGGLRDCVEQRAESARHTGQHDVIVVVVRGHDLAVPNRRHLDVRHLKQTAGRRDQAFVVPLGDHNLGVGGVVDHHVVDPQPQGKCRRRGEVPADRIPPIKPHRCWQREGILDNRVVGIQPVELIPPLVLDTPHEGFDDFSRARLFGHADDSRFASPLPDRGGAPAKRIPCRVSECRQPQYSPLMTKNEPRMVPASFDFCLANLNREASSAGTSMPSDSLNPTARFLGSSMSYITLMESPLS